MTKRKCHAICGFSIMTILLFHVSKLQMAIII